ncbi:MAG: substrate-binding periplasmic protein, partial [Desulfonatronovibrionaceae bacterium]
MKARPGSANELSGLDIQISRELFEQGGYRVIFEPMSWSEILTGLQTGETEFLMGAYYKKSREEFAYYSRPYRTERNDIYYHESIGNLDNLKSVQDVLDFLQSENLNLAVVEGHAYGSKKFARLVRDPPSNLNLIPTQSYRESLTLMLEGIVDLFAANPIIMDRLIAETE